MTNEPPFQQVIADESARFRAALATAPDQSVPTCPDWTTDDLLWHLTEVQWFWGTIVADDVSDPQTLERPDRPGGRAAALAAFDDASAALRQALADTAPDQRRWMWAQDDALHTAGYIARRQAHEALIHRVDAELTAAGPVGPIDPTLAADGVTRWCG
ncbi:maleylpyruvate isomerase N-terminal domain-containing protein [Flexivirga meconopsidis]|uniref:maleylpyruvate isomerase N-terminal domain-containing protein n=1 Tax=Flexivirga meconopsidis TaxID=2977121 RepID=UPI00224077A6|nr:maleylpyruvate isomerase N-terminal domain-containing protein [Flexivirga meconopsidis]